MVVSYQVKIISLFTCLTLLFIPTISLADPEAQLLTDTELDAITASSLPNAFTESLTNELEKILSNSFGSIETILNSGLLSSGLVQVNATDSTVVVQTNIVFFLDATGGTVNINQSNTAFVSN